MVLFAGASVLAGLAVMIILIPVNGVIANRVKILQIKQMKYKDERVKLMNEVELCFLTL
jgi:ATP-binding cassette subfamily C (CFTR/MRP) protein 1